MASNTEDVAFPLIWTVSLGKQTGERAESLLRVCQLPEANRRECELLIHSVEVAYLNVTVYAVEFWQRVMLVAAGGAAGSVMRYLAAVVFGASPVTTFWVNISGSFLIGIIAGATPASDIRLRLLLATGFLGGYTTFSAWQLEALMSAQAEEWGRMAAVLLGSLAAGFGAVAAGYWLAARVLSPS